MGPRTELEAAFFRALTSTMQPFAAIGSSGIVLYWSAGAQQLSGYAVDDVVGRSLGDALPALREAVAQHHDELRAGTAAAFVVHDKHASGAPIELAVHAIPAVSESGEVVATVLDLRATSGSGATIGQEQLSGPGAWHALNNILATVQLYLGFVARSGLSATQSADLQIAFAAARQGAQLIVEEREHHAAAATVSRGRSDVVDVKDVVHQADGKLRRAVGAGVAVSLQLPLSPLLVRATPEELEQVLLNLATNAGDAMAGVGILTITVKNAAISEAHPLAGEVPFGSHAVIALRDTGTGMSPETRARIFEPFFTTKPRGEGSGLGLVTVLARVKQLGGCIRVESELGRGSEFQVYLPLALEPTHSTSVTSEAPRESICVLVVEDDANLRTGLRRILEAEGYQVLEAADGPEAGEVSTRHVGPIQVLLSDLELPRGDGRDALSRVRISRPDISAVFLSGRQDRSRALPSGSEFIQKPFATSERLAVLTRVISNAPSNGGRLAVSKPVVLIVDDDDDLREAFARVIEECDFLALRAKSGLHALQMLEHRHVDVVVCDQFMPGMDGVQLLELVRDRYTHCTRVLFTAHPSSDVVLRAVNRGGVHKVLIKSMHAVAIRDEIERAVMDSSRFRPKKD
jgi:PAS domain S-box-containing protein